MLKRSDAVGGFVVKCSDNVSFLPLRQSARENGLSCLVFLAVLLAVMTALMCSGARAATLTVSPDGTKEFPSITEALKNARDGDEIILSSGTYEEPGECFPLVIGKAVTLSGEKDAVLNAPAFKTALEVTAENVTLKNLNVRLRRWGVLGYADRLALINCTFYLADETYRVSSCGVWLAGVYDCMVENCAFWGCGLCVAGPKLSERSAGMPVLTGLFEVGEDKALFTSHTISGNTVNGKPLYYFAGQTNVVVPSDAGGAIVADCSGVLFDGVDVSDSSMGLEAVHCSDVTVRGATADRCGIFGIYLAYVRDAAVLNAHCGETNHGIDIRDAQRVRVLHAVTQGCEQGVFFSWGTDCSTVGCTIKNCGNGYFSALGVNNLLIDSVISGNENGVNLQDDKSILIGGNEITGNTVTGIRMLRSQGQCVSNNMHDNWVGMIINSSEEILIWNNKFVGNTSTAVYTRDLVNGKICGNNFEGSSKAFIELDGELKNPEFLGNVIPGDAGMIINRTGTLLQMEP